MTGAGALGVAAPAGAAESTAVVDVACLGETLRLMFAPGSHPPDNHAGSTFVVEGWIYPEGTIPGDGFDPASVPAMGRWLCRGWFVDTPDRPQPGVLTTQEYLFGHIGPDELFPTEQLVSSGLEQIANEAMDPAQPALRSVIGGTGRYAGATGTCIQHFQGRNITDLGPGGLAGKAPNFRFEFQLR